MLLEAIQEGKEWQQNWMELGEHSGVKGDSAQAGCGGSIAGGFRESTKQLVSLDEDAAFENQAEMIERVQIKHESQRAPASCIPGNQEPRTGDPTPVVTSQGNGVETNKKGVPHPGPGLLAVRVSRAGRESLGTGLGLPGLQEQALPPAPLSCPLQTLIAVSLS